jgi:hypothetical protein
VIGERTPRGDAHAGDPPHERRTVEVPVTCRLDTAEEVEDLRSRRRAATLRAGFQNAEGQEISWSLYNIVDINPMLEDSFDEVTEIYARHFRDIEAYRKFETFSK